jgi:hypothetical protein
MNDFIQYNPKKHKGLPLYEIQSEEKGPFIASVVVKSDVTHEIAAQIPWYYIVKKEDITKNKQLIIIKGSRRSGNWGHSGKAGMHGGSDEGGGHGAVAASRLPGGKGKQKKLPFKVKKPKKISNTPQEAAVAKLKKAEALEKVATSMVTEIAKEQKSELFGLEYRMKTAESLAEKIKIDVEEKGLTTDEAADSINDAVRYTMLYEREDFVSKVSEAQTLLAERGWTQYDNKYKNFFAGGDAYDGYNTVLVNKATGERFELQFHTPESIKIKVKIHPWYKEFQETTQESPRRLELLNMMKAEWENYERPVGWENLLGVRIG